MPTEISSSEFETYACLIRSGQVPQQDVPKLLDENPAFGKWYRDHTTPTLRALPSPTEAIELAYGLLWLVGVNRSTPNGNATYHARKTLLDQIDREGQARGITAARKLLDAETFGRPRLSSQTRGSPHG